MLLTSSKSIVKKKYLGVYFTESTLMTESPLLDQITSLSKVSHKNFMNLLGYCEEDQPFTRAMVFEYAPNGTLFEHLHGK